MLAWDCKRVGIHTLAFTVLPAKVKLLYQRKHEIKVYEAPANVKRMEEVHAFDDFELILTVSI